MGRFPWCDLRRARRRGGGAPGHRLLPTPGHTPGHQSVRVDTPDGLVVIGGDVAYTFHELGSGATEGQRRVLALAAPTWLTHAEGGRRFLARTRTTTRAGARPSRGRCGGRAGSRERRRERGPHHPR